MSFDKSISRKKIGKYTETTIKTFKKTKKKEIESDEVLKLYNVFMKKAEAIDPEARILVRVANGLNKHWTLKGYQEDDLNFKDHKSYFDGNVEDYTKFDMFTDVTFVVKSAQDIKFKKRIFNRYKEILLCIIIIYNIKKMKPVKDRKEYMKNYYTKNKKKISERMKELVVCAFCGRKIQHTRLGKHYESKICAKNREQKVKMLKNMSELHKKYDCEMTSEYDNMIKHLNHKYELEKEATLAETKKKLNKENKGVQIKCECGGTYLYQHRNNHFKTLKHQKYIDSLIEDNNLDENVE